MKLPALLFRSLAGLLTLVAAPAIAADVQVAVAANFAEPAKQIAAAFEKATGHKAILAFGSSGTFYAQISHGAPFEVFLSADAERPTLAESEGYAVAGSRFTYAIGRLVLYSTTAGLVDARGKILSRPGSNKVAIADPATAPYGLAAMETMRKLGVLDALKPRLVIGSSIAQTYQFVSTGAAPLGFVAFSQVVGVTGGSRWLVPASYHTPIDQQAALLKKGAGNPAAHAFVRYLKSGPALAIIKRYGYGTL